MDRFIGIIGIAIILGIALLMSNNRKSINWILVVKGLAVQLVLALFILKLAPYWQGITFALVDVAMLAFLVKNLLDGKAWWKVGIALAATQAFMLPVIAQAIGWFDGTPKPVFKVVGEGITKLLDFSNKGSEFVFGPLSNTLMHAGVLDKTFGPEHAFIFAIKVVPTIIFVAALVSMMYHLGIMQRVISLIARGVYYIMPVSGAEALSNVASAFVGQVEAQIMIKPYVDGMTKSELLASMSGSMACIAGGVMAVYISFGVPAEYLLAASIMAAPAALVISKIVYPETEESQTKGFISLQVEKTHANILDALSHGASDGMKISINVLAMLLAFIAVIAMGDFLLGQFGSLLFNIGLSPDMVGFDLQTLSFKTLLGGVFSFFAYIMGVPAKDTFMAGQLMGTKMVINEFVAYLDLAPLIGKGTLEPKTIVIVSFALCGFANFSSIAIQVGGIGELAPSRRADLAKLGFRALICGTLASYLSATIAGILF
ncbi:MAG: hypothetical protein RI894_1268 [Bacteroidota bacterium]|jgi:CNT family concentrative nucleoside transporter